MDGVRRLANIRGSMSLFLLQISHLSLLFQPSPKTSSPPPLSHSRSPCANQSFPPTELRKKVWINQGDIILLSLRDYQDNKGDVILKYTVEEARSLKAYGELPEHAKINETDTYGADGDGDCNFEFDDDRDSSSDDATGGAGGKEVDIDDI